MDAMRFVPALLAFSMLVVACKRHETSSTSVPFGVCLGPRGWRTPQVRIEPGDEVSVVVSPNAGCVSSSMQVKETPRVKRTSPSSFTIEGELRLESPSPGGPVLADCGGGAVELPLGRLAAGHYVVRTARAFEFDVPMLREMSKPICDAPPPAPVTPAPASSDPLSEF